jgi:ABC-type transport system involved in multi-copper enzyme maturation permease subunit
MRWLLWKDYRHNRLIVFTTLVLLLGPHLIALGVMCGGPWIKIDTRHGHPVYWTPPKWQDIMAGTSIYSVCISQLAAALIGGNAIAGERVDRSAEFLYSLPIRRRKLLASKLLLAMAIAVAIWLVNALIFSSIILYELGGVPIPLPNPVNWNFFVNRDVLLVMAMIATTGLTFFCIAWFFSSFIASPTVAICAGLITPVLLASGIALVDMLLAMSGLKENRLGYPAANLWYLGICLTLSVVCFGVGTWHYLRRVEP